MLLHTILDFPLFLPICQNSNSHRANYRYPKPYAGRQVTTLLCLCDVIKICQISGNSRSIFNIYKMQNSMMSKKKNQLDIVM